MIRKTWVYFRLQLKRSLRFLPFVLVISLFLSLGLGLVIGKSIESDANSVKNQKLTVGIVGDTEGSYLDMGFAAIQSMDTSRFSMDLVEMSEKEADEKLRSGELIAYIMIPDGFMDGAMHGDINPIKYYTRNNSVGITKLFQDEVLTVVSRMLSESQKGVFGTMNALDDRNIPNSGDRGNQLCVNYVSLILNRPNACSIEVVGVSDHLSFPAYMATGISILMVLLFGIACSPLFIKHDMELSRLLNARGGKSAIQVICEYLCHFLIMFITVSLVFAALFTIAGDSVEVIPELCNIGFKDVIMLILKMIPALLLLTSMQFFMYEISENTVSGVLIQFFVSVGLAYISGCFYPIGFFPKVIRAVSSVFPVGIAREYLCGAVSGQQTGILLPVALIYTAVLIFGCILVRNKKIARA